MNTCFCKLFVLFFFLFSFFLNVFYVFCSVFCFFLFSFFLNVFYVFLFSFLFFFISCCSSLLFICLFFIDCLFTSFVYFLYWVPPFECVIKPFCLCMFHLLCSTIIGRLLRHITASVAVVSRLGLNSILKLTLFEQLLKFYVIEIFRNMN